MIEMLGKNIILDNEFEIKEYYTDKGVIRVLFNKGAIFSASFIDANLQNELCDYYTAYFDIPVLLNPLGKKSLVLGGGAFSYPKYYISHYKDKSMTVVEYDSKCIDIARQYFGLDELIDTFDSKHNRLKIIVDDAVRYLGYCQERFDYILVDLFNGKRPTKEIFLINNLMNLKKILYPDGVIVVNYVISDENLLDYKVELKNLLSIANYYKIITNENYYKLNEKTGNLLIVLSDKNIQIPDFYSFIDLTSGWSLDI